MPFFPAPQVITGTYTPTLTNAVIGTGGTPVNTAKWTFVGGPSGILSVQGSIKFGSSGQTFPSQPLTVSLPSGYQFEDAPTGADDKVGDCMMNDYAGPNIFPGICQYSSSTAVRMTPQLASGTYVQLTGISTTVPFTWGTDDELAYRYTIRAKQV